MSFRTTQNLEAAKHKKTGAGALISGPVAYTLIGLLFSAFLILSAMNDYMFFGWLAMGTFIVFALMGMHFIGQKQVKKI